MLKLLLVRTGSTDFDRQRRIQGTLDVPLNDDGQQEAARAGEELRSQPLEVVYTAPCKAAEQTAQRIAEACGAKTKKLEQLKNLDHGLWQGMLVEDVKAKQPKVYRQWQEQPETVCPPSGETLNSAKKRLQQILNRLAKKHKEGTIGIVASEPLASLICQVLRQDELGDLWNARQHCEWEIIPVPPKTLATEA